MASLVDDVEMKYVLGLGSFGLPEGCLKLPEEVEVEKLIAIVTVHDAEAFTANRDTPYSKVRIKATDPKNSMEDVIGCHIFLRRIAGKAAYDFGRSKPALSSSPALPLDVFLPNSNIAKKQCTLLPDRETGRWRVESASETVTTVNGVPLQKYTTRTKKHKVNMPQTLYLDHSRANIIEVHGMRMTVWMIMKATDILAAEPNYQHPPSMDYLQNVDGRHEAWARSRYVLTRNAAQVSGRSFRVHERFVGRIETAKLFREQGGRDELDQELLMFGKEKVHESIVRYKASAELDGIPAAITDTHQGMVPYGAMQSDLKDQHPGFRFQIASAILRPLFSALEFLHRNRIMHGDVSWESVLLRLESERVRKVLLVNYRNAYMVPPDDDLPRDAMLQDARQAMEVIEDCCNIWALRKAPAPNALAESEMRVRAVEAEDEFLTVQRRCAFVFNVGGEDRRSREGKQLLRLLAKKEAAWSRAKTDQINNAGQMQIGLVTKEKLDGIKEKWKTSEQKTDGAKFHFMILTLGHKLLDGLSDHLYRHRWDFLPQDVCVALRSLEGEVKDPWRTFPVSVSYKFEVGVSVEKPGIVESSLAAWLATCCEMHHTCRKTIIAAYNKFIARSDTTVPPDAIRAFRATLKKFDCLPATMGKTLRTLEALADSGSTQAQSIEEIHEIWYHMPSAMFNVSQLHRTAGLERLDGCMKNESIRCENFQEVRGESAIQGNYLPLALLPPFASALGIVVRDMPAIERPSSGLDPSDFSQIPHGRIVLAHRGLVGFASVVRSGNQFTHAPESPLDIESADPFLPTYFGDMKVLPYLPEDPFNHPRPTHWAKFKTAKEIEEAADVRERRVLKPKGPSGKCAKPRTPTESPIASQASSPARSSDTSLTQIQRALKERANVIEKARTPTKRRAEGDVEEEGVTPRHKRAHLLKPTSHRENQGLTQSFKGRNTNLVRSPPLRGLDPLQKFATEEQTRLQRVADLEAIRQMLEDSSSSSEEELGAPPFELRNVRILLDGLPRSRCADLTARDERELTPTEVASTVGDTFYQQSMIHPPTSPFTLEDAEGSRLQEAAPSMPDTDVCEETQD